jgi:hypothetical protein
VCLAPAPAQPPVEALVVVSSRLQPGFLDCSGIAIAPRLVLTALECVVRPPELGDPDADDPRASARFQDVYFAGIDYDQSCVRDSWAAREDGSFSGRLGKLIEAQDIVVYFQEDDGREVSVTGVTTSRAGSRCADGLALLTLERDLVVPEVNLRLDELTQLGDAVTLNGHCVPPDGSSRARGIASQVEALNENVGSSRAPPRSLWMRDAVSSLDFGGAVLSSSGGVLIGILVSGDSPGCDSPDSSGGSVALRLAPFRRMLIDAARSMGVILRSESALLGATQLAPCSENKGPPR